MFHLRTPHLPLLAVLLLALATAAPADVLREWPAMGTRIRLRVRGSGPAAESAADAMAAAARDALETVEAATSVFRAGSPPALLADAAGSGGWIPVPPAFEDALDVALRTADATAGAFNPLVAPLMELHGHPRRPPDTPAPVLPPPTPELLDWRRIERRPGACRLPVPGMRLDLGGVAKGVGADRAAAAARAAGTNDFLLDAGGTLVGRGTWTAGLRNPLAAADAAPLRPFTLPAGHACATSGNYERPGHLIDPRNGAPAAGRILQTTVLAPTATLADAWSTALFILGPDDGRRAMQHTPGIAAAWVLQPPDGGAPVVVQQPAPPQPATPLDI